MKVLLINGSPRKDGNTGIALAEVSATLEEEDEDQLHTPSGSDGKKHIPIERVPLKSL